MITFQSFTTSVSYDLPFIMGSQEIVTSPISYLTPSITSPSFIDRVNAYAFFLNVALISAVAIFEMFAFCPVNSDFPAH